MSAEAPANIPANDSIAKPNASLFSNPDVITDPLPDGYPIHQLLEARMLYRDRRPPFVLRKQSDTSRTCVVPTKEGVPLRPEFPTLIDIIARPWDKEHIFWTLDINLIRYIVRAFPSKATGTEYLRWSYPADEFEEPALALCEYPPTKPQPVTTIDDSSSDDDDKIIPIDARRRSRRATTVNSPVSTRITRPPPSDSLNPVTSTTFSQHRYALKQVGQSTPTPQSSLPTSSSNPEAAARPASHPPVNQTTPAAYKHSRTTLLIRVAPSSEYQPLKLSDCPDIQTLIDKVLGAWSFEAEDVTKVTITFNWMAQDDRMRTMVLNPHEGCFAHLIEVVEDAPCWEEGEGRCALDVEIVSTLFA